MSSVTSPPCRSSSARAGPSAAVTSTSPCASARVRLASSGKRRNESRRTRGVPAQWLAAASSSTRPGPACASRNGPVPTGSSPRTASCFGLCIAKNGCDSVERRAALGRSSVSCTTCGPTRSARPGKASALRRCSRFLATASASSGAPSWNTTSSRSVSVQTRWSGVAHAVARTPSGRSDPGLRRTSVSHTFATISAATRSVARCGARLAGSLSVPTTIVSGCERAASAVRTSAPATPRILVRHS